MPTFAVFPGLQPLVLNVHLCSPDLLLPEHVLETSDHRFAVEVGPEQWDLEQVQSYFGSLCRQSDLTVEAVSPGEWRLAPPKPKRRSSSAVPALPAPWSVRVSTHVTGQPVALRQVVVHPTNWVYRDPQRPRPRYNAGLALSGWPAPLAQRADEVDVPTWATEPGMEYLLAARDEQEAQSLLDGLTAVLVTGITARPVQLDPASDGCPYRFFWRVERSESAVPLQVLRQAARAWWGPVTTGATKVYLEWPYTLQVAPAVLERINWGQPGEVVLLGRATPTGADAEVVVLAEPADHRAFRPLLEVANLHTAASAPSEVIAVDREPAEQIEVDLRLVDRHQRSQRADRIELLRQELNARELLLRRLEEQHTRQTAAETVVEPLYLYQARRPAPLADGPMLPAALQRLVVEWSDQSGDLASLFCQRLGAGSLPPNLVDASCDVYVVTTAAALGRANDPAQANPASPFVEDVERVGLRLQDYTPTEGKLTAFRLLPEWTQHGLRLFVPAGRRLDLYPAMAPSLLTIPKLWQALLPPDVPELASASPKDWLALLSPTDDHQVQAQLLRVAGFGRLTDSFAWQCRLDVALPASWQTQLDDLGTQAQEYFLTTVTDAYEQATRTMADARVTAHTETLQAKLEQQRAALEAEYQDRRTRLERQHNDRVTQLEGEAKVLVTRAAALQAAIAVVREGLERVLRTSARLDATIDAYRQHCRTLERDADGLLADEQRLAARLRATDQLVKETTAAHDELIDARADLARVEAALTLAQRPSRGQHDARRPR